MAYDGIEYEEVCEFVRDLSEGSSGDDVACLQRFLGNEGYYEGPVTAYFGDLTRTAVKRWQTSRCVFPSEGYFGRLSRRAYRKQTSQRELVGLRVALDVGHGAHPLGYEVGVKGNGLTELELNKVLCSELKDRLEDYGATVNVYEYGLSGPYLWLPERGRRASGHNIFISCHHNGHNGTAQGTETLVDIDATERDMQLARTIHTEVVEALRLTDRGVKYQKLGVLGGVTSDVEAACLIEPYFIDDINHLPKEVIGPGLSRQAACAVAAGVRKYWLTHNRPSYDVELTWEGEAELKRLREKAPDAWCVRFKGDETRGCLKVQAGSFDDYDRAMKFQQLLADDGFQATVRLHKKVKERYSRQPRLLPSESEKASGESTQMQITGGHSKYIDFDSEAADSGSFEMEPDLKENLDFLTGSGAFMGLGDIRGDPFAHDGERTIMDPKS